MKKLVPRTKIFVTGLPTLPEPTFYELPLKLIKSGKAIAIMLIRIGKVHPPYRP